jgi:predicted  nucleic acid-binding Zn-ribbon protein
MSTNKTETAAIWALKRECTLAERNLEALNDEERRLRYRLEEIQAGRPLVVNTIANLSAGIEVLQNHE